MNDQLAHNLKVIRGGIKYFISKTEERVIRSVFTITASAVYEWIDDHPLFYKDQTYNLRDSIGVGVYKDGVLLNWIQHPSPKATVRGKYAPPHKEDAPALYYTYFQGRDLLNQAISNGVASNFAKYVLVVYATAPYGLLVEDGGGKRGTGWWTEGLVPYVKKRFLSELTKFKNSEAK